MPKDSVPENLKPVELPADIEAEQNMSGSQRVPSGSSFRPTKSGGGLGLVPVAGIAVLAAILVTVVMSTMFNVGGFLTKSDYEKNSEGFALKENVTTIQTDVADKLSQVQVLKENMPSTIQKAIDASLKEVTDKANAAKTTAETAAQNAQSALATANSAQAKVNETYTKSEVDVKINSSGVSYSKSEIDAKLKEQSDLIVAQETKLKELETKVSAIATPTATPTTTPTNSNSSTSTYGVVTSSLSTPNLSWSGQPIIGASVTAGQTVSSQTSFNLTVTNASETLTAKNIQLAIGLVNVDSNGNPVTAIQQWLSDSTFNLSSMSTGTLGTSWVAQGVVSSNTLVFYNQTATSIFSSGITLAPKQSMTITVYVSFTTQQAPILNQNVYFYPLIKTLGYAT